MSEKKIKSPKKTSSPKVKKTTRKISKNTFSYNFSTYLFLKLLAVIYLVAFYSLSSQIIGLVGYDGILPVEGYLENAKLGLGDFYYLKMPTLCWFSTSESFLQFLCSGGVLLSILLFFGHFSFFLLIVLWLFYLSLTIAGQTFLGFQWDNLLLEVGFLSIFLVPITKRIKAPFEPSKVSVWLFRFLLFKLMFMSGVVKLASGDPTWKNFTALTYHYWTQPLPNPIAFRISLLPVWFHKLSCFLMFVIELIIPFFIFAKRPLKLVAGILFIGFQLLIILTGNYCFFNLLTIALCLFLIDDDFWKYIATKTEMKVEGGIPKWHRIAIIPVAVLITIVSSMQMIRVYQFRDKLPKLIVDAYLSILPYRSINNYGLFAVMTKTRPEIIIEGSNDGKNWKPYEFKHKPGRLNKRLSFVAPHQPRVDWQMWFAALGNYKRNPWFTNFCMRLLQGKKEVIALVDKNPFPDKPPKYIRALLYEYEFTDLGTLRSTGRRWKRELKGLYCPVLHITK